VVVGYNYFVADNNCSPADNAAAVVVVDTFFVLVVVAVYIVVVVYTSSVGVAVSDIVDFSVHEFVYLS